MIMAIAMMMMMFFVVMMMLMRMSMMTVMAPLQGHDLLIICSSYCSARPPTIIGHFSLKS